MAVLTSFSFDFPHFALVKRCFSVYTLCSDCDFIFHVALELKIVVDGVILRHVNYIPLACINFRNHFSVVEQVSKHVTLSFECRKPRDVYITFRNCQVYDLWKI